MDFLGPVNWMDQTYLSVIPPNIYHNNKTVQNPVSPIVFEGARQQRHIAFSHCHVTMAKGSSIKPQPR